MCISSGLSPQTRETQGSMDGAVDICTTKDVNFSSKTLGLNSPLQNLKSEMTQSSGSEELIWTLMDRLQA